MTLSKEKLMKYNLQMLGKGAPVELDNLGYNQIDYSHMANLSHRNELTDNEAHVLASVLLKYANTQLTAIKSDLKDTVEHYRAIIKEVTVVDFDKSVVKLSWEFNTNISNFIKNDLDRTYFRWKRPKGSWVLEIQWEFVQTLLNTFVSEGYGVSNVELIRDNLDAMFEEKLNKPVDLKLVVMRTSDTIDTLECQVEYHKAVSEAFKNVPYANFNKDTKRWEIYIEYSLIAYTELSKLHLKGFDISELEPWAKLVTGWGTSYQLTDLTQYSLPFSPWEFQPKDATKLLELKVGLNACDMGCGKTFEQIIIGESLPMSKLVIVPPTLRLNWRKEILSVNPNANVHILYSADDYQVVNGWNIIGYNSLDKFLPQLEQEQFQCIMIDEAHYIQAISNSGTPNSNRAYAVLRLCATSNYVYPITGTPKTNRNKNLFNILRVMRHPLTRGKWAFMNYGKTYCDGQKGSFGWNFNGNSHDEDLNAQLTPFMVRHLKKDVLPHLKKQRIVIPVEVDLREYHYEISQYLSERKNKNAESLARLMRARKILATQKIGETVDMAKNFILEDKKVVIVSCFTDVVKAVESAFKDNCVKITGGMSDTAKEAAKDQFQNGKPQVIVINIVAGGVGITLTKSHNMIVNDFDWTPGNLTQAEDRICRGGQTEEFSNIYYPYAEGADMDEVFAESLTQKFDTINSVVDGGQGDSIDYLKLIDEALEKSSGVKITRKIVKVEETVSKPKNVTKLKTTNNYTGKTLDDLIQLAKTLGVAYKEYKDPKIFRMRLVMELKKHSTA